LAFLQNTLLLSGEILLRNLSIIHIKYNFKLTKNSDPMIVRKIAIATILFASLCFNSFGQEMAKTTTTTGIRSLTPYDKWEIGLSLGVPMVVGDITAKPGLGFGGHLRKSLDHIFSVRGNLNFAKTKNDNGTRDLRTSDMTWISGSGHLVATLNNIRFNKPYRKVNINAFGGIGLNSFNTNYKSIVKTPGATATDGKESFQNAQFEVGAELLLRLNSKVNFGLGYTVFTSFGKGADLLDGDNNPTIAVTTYRDNLHYPHASINFNIGKKSAKDGSLKSEPLYWVNPLIATQDAIASLEARPVYDPTDTDGDGVIDATDQEKDTPAGARVDARGVTLDSDSDGLADYKDKEPFSPIGYKVDGMGVAQVPKEPKLTDADVNRMIDAKLANFKLPSQKGLVDWFLPMIHFGLDQYSINKGEYEKLYQVATVMKQNPELRVVVAGHTDRSSSNRYNNVLSYNRAKAAIDFLVSQHGISRDRLVLNWGGEDTSLVPTNAANYINRRVEFRVAAGESEMGRPDGPNAGNGGRFSGNKDAGY
jgi:OmpA-OmpF porin, OOP family